MLGAVVGDVVGSVYEFANTKNYNFDLFTKESSYTDDSVMTFALAGWLLKDSEHSFQGLEDTMVRYGKDYPCPIGGYGGGFHTWLFSPEHLYSYDYRYGQPPYESLTGRHPYGSWGNGSAMRASAVGWFFDTLEETEHVAKISAEITHNHPEGIKGAQATAAAIWMARNGKSKEEIRSYIESRYGYDLHKTYSYWHPIYRWDSSCQGTVPQAIICFLDSANFEDAIRKAVSLGGDSDTLACITGGIAEAFYGGVPHKIAGKVLGMLPDDFIAILREMQRRTVYGTACPIDDARFKKSAPEMDKETRKALTMWTMGLGNSNKRFFGEDFNPDKVKKATADSWKTKPMEEPAIEVDMNFSISARQMAIISYGHIPEAMEDHWFMYCDDSHIRYYRSWTGLFVFDASYVKADDGDGFVIVKLRIHPNKDYSEEYEKKQTTLFKALLMDECGGNSEEYWDEYLQ